MTTTFRTGDDRYRWVNNAFVIAEAILDSGNAGGKAYLRLYSCTPTIEFPDEHTLMTPADYV